MKGSLNTEKQKKLAALFEKAPIKKSFNMTLSFNEKNQAIFELPYKPDLTNATGGFHGGVIATLIDNAGWFTAAQYYENWIATVEFKVHFIRPVKDQDIYSIGKLIHAGKRLAMCEMQVRTIDDDQLVATGSGTFSNTSVKLQV